jgi:hypothetical protein
VLATQSLNGISQTKMLRENKLPAFSSINFGLSDWLKRLSHPKTNQ